MLPHCLRMKISLVRGIGFREGSRLNGWFALVETYTLIYAFLTQHNHLKAAKNFRKSAQPIVDLKDGPKLDRPALEDIVKQWKVFIQRAPSPPSSTYGFPTIHRFSMLKVILNCSSDSDSPSSLSAAKSKKRKLPGDSNDSDTCELYSMFHASST